MTPTYRRQFADAAKAEEYDAVQYGTSSYSDVLWRIEREQLTAIVKDLRATHESIEYLDFATGTGRVLGHVAPLVDEATGIDISEAMIERARSHVDTARLICADVTAPGARIEGRYDLITAFRFVLNAEPSLRHAGLAALAARLRDDTSVLVFNNHGNLLSHKLLLWPLHRLRRLGRGAATEGNYLSGAAVRRLATEVGLRIERSYPSGYLSAKVLRIMSTERAARLEERLARSTLLRRFAVNQMYVARRA
ncbi:MAG: class I SAM-dependent methyltransferase [Planctomycetes bacterium]|nr:class I SAM-dependent methyltransferase [Planctomycetota bacterium]